VCLTSTGLLMEGVEDPVLILHGKHNIRRAIHLSGFATDGEWLIPPLSNSTFRSLDKGRVFGKAGVLDCMAALPKSPAVNNAITASLPAKVTDHFQLAFTSGRIVRCSVQPCLHLCAKIVSP
jgi:hypothetical protein